MDWLTAICLSAFLLWCVGMVLAYSKPYATTPNPQQNQIKTNNVPKHMT
jgi:hypothetical protein